MVHSQHGTSITIAVVCVSRDLGHVHLFKACACVGCSTNYHHNYFVRDGQRYYYEGIPDFLQVGEHQYVDQALANAWIDLMVVSWYVPHTPIRMYYST